MTPEPAICFDAPFDFPTGGHYFAGCPTCTPLLEGQINEFNTWLVHDQSLGGNFMLFLYDRGEFSQELLNLYNRYLNEEYPANIDGYVEFLKGRLDAIRDNTSG